MSKKRTMPTKFFPLAEYNSEVARGLVHTKEHKRRMRALQEEFNWWNNPEKEATRPWFFGWDYW